MNMINLLLVDDDDPTITMYRRTFRCFANLAIDHATSNEEALIKIAAQSYDCIITDIKHCGDDSGIDLTRAIKQMSVPKQSLIFIISGIIELYKDDAIDAGADWIYPKPFEKALLLKTMKEKMPALQMAPHT